MHEIHQLGDFWLQDLHRLLIDLHPVGLFVAFHLRRGMISVSFTVDVTLGCKTWTGLRHSR